MWGGQETVLNHGPPQGEQAMCSMGNSHGTAVPTSDGHTEWLARGLC